MDNKKKKYERNRLAISDESVNVNVLISIPRALSQFILAISLDILSDLKPINILRNIRTPVISVAFACNRSRLVILSSSFILSSLILN
jgi:hypothetical protein